MTAIAPNQIDSYLRNDNLISLKKDEAFQKACNLEERGKQEERLGLDTKTSENAHEAFVFLAKSYMEKAQNAQDLDRAYYCAHARQMLTYMVTSDKQAAARIKENATLNEAKSCFEVAQKMTDPGLKALLALKSARLLMPDPEQIPTSRNIEKYHQAAKSWELLADILLTDKPTIENSDTNLVTDPFKLNYTAAKCYEYAAYALRSARSLIVVNQKTSQWIDLDTRRVQLIDQAIETLESQEIKISECVFTAKYFETLAGLYQFKLTTYEVFKKTGVDTSDLKKVILEYRKSSATHYDKALKKDPSNTDLHYKKALNLREAARHVATIEKAAKLLNQAATSATTFRENKKLPVYYPISEECEMACSGESEVERTAYTILVDCRKMEKLLEEKGPRTSCKALN